MLKLRPYQEEISAKAVDILKSRKIVYLAMEVRTGKTITALSIAERCGAKNVLFLTKKKAVESGTIQNDYNLLAPSYSITITNNESLHKVTDNDFDLLVSDEHHRCFLGNTKIGCKKIKDIKVGSFQKSFNFVKNIYEYKRVVNVFKNKLSVNLIKIKCNGKEIVCTENHEIYTKRGWIKAGELLSTDELQVVRK